MAEPVGLASAVVALATFAFKSGTKLYNTIQDFRCHPRQVRELLAELSGLTSVLQQLSETGNLGLDLDLTPLTLMLEQCRRSCDDVEKELQTYYSRSSVDRASFRDWAKLKCSGGDGIEGFRQQLIGYKSTITVVLTFANLRASSTTIEAIHACRDLIVTATVDLESHLDDVQQKLETLTQRTSVGANPDNVIRQRMEEEQRSTEKGLEFCAILSKAIEKIQFDFFGGERGSPNIQDPDSTSQMLFGEGIDGCMHHIRFTLSQLERQRSNLIESLGTGSTATISAQDQVSLDKLQVQAKTLRHCLDLYSDVDAFLESQVSNIENHAEGDDTIQFMVSTNGKPINGTNRGTGMRLKQAGGHFSDASLQQVSQDFTTISIHQTGLHTPKISTSMPGDDAASDRPRPPFHGQGFTLAKPSPPVTPRV